MAVPLAQNHKQLERLFLLELPPHRKLNSTRQSAVTESQPQLVMRVLASTRCRAESNDRSAAFLGSSPSNIREVFLHRYIRRGAKSAEPFAFRDLAKADAPWTAQMQSSPTHSYSSLPTTERQPPLSVVVISIIPSITLGT